MEFIAMYILVPQTNYGNIESYGDCIVKVIASLSFQNKFIHNSLPVGRL